jgi:hypothetical protein
MDITRHKKTKKDLAYISVPGRVKSGKSNVVPPVFF